MPPSTVATPPSAVVPPQSIPSVMVQLTPVATSGAQVPFVAPAATVQVPLQQSAFSVQTSPFCVQNEDGKQTPM